MFQEVQVTKEYIRDGCVYTITDTEEFHSRLENDPAFSEAYFATSSGETKCMTVEPEVEKRGQSNVEWSEEATDFLVAAYNERKDRFNDPKHKKKLLWTDISQEMENAGFHYDHRALDNKWHNMKLKYKKIKENARKNKRCKIEWKWFDTFDELSQEEANAANNCDYDDHETLAGPTEFVAVEEDSDFEESDNDEQDMFATKWSEEATHFFLEAYQKRQDLFRDRKSSRKHLWSEVLQEMKVAGFDVGNEVTLNQKMRNLINMYKRRKDDVDKGRLGGTRWKYYTTMDNIFKKGHPFGVRLTSQMMEFSETDDSLAPDMEKFSANNSRLSKSSLFKIRKKYLDVEERKVKALHETNRLLAERNELLRELIRAQAERLLPTATDKIEV